MIVPKAIPTNMKTTEIPMASGAFDSEKFAWLNFVELFKRKGCATAIPIWPIKRTSNEL